jgi:hypothetical protein
MEDDRTVGQRNLEHVLEDSCTDPDCELHNPEVIETSEERWTAKAWFLAGSHAMLRALESEEITSTHEDPLVAALAHVKVQHGLTPNWP